jgi:hypothetical protein
MLKPGLFPAEEDPDLKPLETFNFCNNFAPGSFQIPAHARACAPFEVNSGEIYCNSFKITNLAIENLYPLKAEMIPGQLFDISRGIVDVTSVF